jgi:thioredoxin-related protein
MKRLILIFLFLATANIFAQKWYTDMDTAQAKALQENKIIVLVFQGSDWCAPCMKLEKEIFSTSEFLAYADKNYVMLQADFPRKRKNKLAKEQKKKNAILFEKYNTNGIFPFVVVLDSAKKILKKAGYKKMLPSKYIDYLNSY